MSGTDAALIARRFEELAERAYASGRYTYSDFLGLMETDILMRVKKDVEYAGVTLYGGAEGCERVVARFGNSGICTPDGGFPISCVAVRPLSAKFADELTHRDILGAVMNLGIKREKTGDIFFEKNTAYVFCISAVADVIISELDRTSHTSVKCEAVNGLPEGIGSRKENVQVLITSERLDALISAVYRISRESSLELFREEKVFCDGRICLNNSAALKEGQTISVRGYGRFVYTGVQGQSKKGRLYVGISKYV